MNRPKSHRIKLTLAALAVAMLFYVALPSAAIKATYALNCDDGGGAIVGSRARASLILFNRGAIDTSARADLDTAALDARPSPFNAHSLSGSAQKQLRVVQFSGPIKRAWVDRLKAAGVEIIGYIPNNAYIIRGAQPQLARAAMLHKQVAASDEQPIGWMGRFEPILKIDPRIEAETAAYGGYGLDVEIELLDSAESEAAIEYINSVSQSINRAPRQFLNFVVVSVTLPAHQLLRVASFEEVLFVGLSPEAKLMDERSAQIVAANLTPDLTQPAGPGYLEWLESKGLNTNPDFVIDITDTGLDRGSTAPTLIHPDFLNGSGGSRIAYNINYTTDNHAEDRRGHGTLVASIAGGAANTGMTDAAGYLFGLGVEPNARLGASRIFNDNGRLPFLLSFTGVASAAYGRGARISNNSWGNGGNTYDTVAQEYDALARDAQPNVAGNQEMLFVFSAGNTGGGGRVSSPGTAKNGFTVAASENFRPEGFDSCNLDGGGAIGPEGANSALDILRFSSGGPTFDGRRKPDIAAPGTHIYGAASRAGLFNGDGLCPGIGLFQPPGQTLYTWSSGTSLAAPHLSGAAALTRKFFTARNLLGASRAPSPAMMKAYLINSAMYLTGENAGGNLPAERQGWGLVHLARAFEETDRTLIDQTELFTESGQSLEIRGSIADRSKPLRVTLAWTDAPGVLAGAAIVNDLDLEITIGGVTVYRGNNFSGEFSVAGGEADRLNNVESIFLPASAIPEGHQGNFTIAVRAANIAGDAVPGNGNELDQDFALVVYNIADPINEPPPPRRPAIDAATYVKKRLTITGRNFSVASRVEVNGQLLDYQFEFDPQSNSLRLKKKRRKLKLNLDADNQIVVIDGNERSLPFTLRL